MLLLEKDSTVMSFKMCIRDRVSKNKNGGYSVASVSCRRMKTVGAVTTATTDGELKYSRDGACLLYTSYKTSYDATKTLVETLTKPAE